jgi:hypothetical protein
MAPPDPIPDLLKAVNDASGRAFALWVTFLTVGAYLAIAIGTTTNVQLLLEGPVKLPLLGVDLPLFSFYQFAPPLFVVLHLYVLMQLYLLARSLRVFDDQLQDAWMPMADRRIVRTQLDKFVFTQLLIAAPDSSIIRVLLRLAVWLSFVVAPILLLLGFQLRFLPYHSVPVTYIHRLTLLLDVVLLWLMWPRISRGGTRPPRIARRQHPIWWITLGLASAALITGSFCVWTVPDEYIEQARLWAGPTSKLWAGLISNRSYLMISPDAQLVEPDQEKLSKLDRSISLRDRDLRAIRMSAVNLRRADLTRANMSYAELSSTHLDDANLSDARLASADMFDARLVNANLYRASLANADLSLASLANADLSYARLVNANLSRASLAHANLSYANLANANLDHANLANADLDHANLANADLDHANLANADLSGANLGSAGNLSQEQLEVTCGDDKTKLPSGLTIRKLCPKSPATQLQ